MDHLQAFIINLASRFRKENDLSDITWAMCQTSDQFLDSFVEFFFPGLGDCEIDLRRELAEDDSRPDFFFQANGKDYLVECKIYDHNHHFEQYTKRFKIEPEQLGYITNYPLRKEGFTVHTWTDFYVYLSKRIPAEEAPLWNGYLGYLKDVCSIFITEAPMNLDGMFSLYTFYRSLDDVFAFDNERYSSFLYDSRKDTNNGGNFSGRTPREGVMGKYFEIKFKNLRMRTAWGWMGVYFEREHPLVCVGFDDRDGWGKPVYDLLIDRLDDQKDGLHFDAPYYDEETDGIWFDFNKGEEFNHLSDPQKQITLLRSFLAEVFDTIYSIKQSTLQ